MQGDKRKKKPSKISPIFFFYSCRLGRRRRRFRYFVQNIQKLKFYSYVYSSSWVEGKITGGGMVGGVGKTKKENEEKEKKVEVKLKTCAQDDSRRREERKEQKKKFFFTTIPI